ncbi:MAG: methionyl-tRNA formyltransferase [Clostridiales bacterium]|nr:methionyl-tRNA formyltransferase [Clostridiales bacterium]
MGRSDLKIVFMGTPEFSATCLRALIDNGYNVMLAVSQPDKPVGRKHIITAPPVKELALSCGIEVFQPDSMKSDEAFEKLSSLSPDLVVTAAYGKILPKRVLDIPKYGCINVHASLLPKYRGASPVQNAILNGDEVTGVTIMNMDVGMDTGDILTTVEVPIDINIHTDALMNELAVAGSSLLIDTIDDLVEGKITPVKQDESLATSCPMI